MFRTDSDYIRGINCLCIAAYRTNSDLLAYAFMSNHVHLCTRTENPSLLMRHYRYMYSRYFNAKYQRSGRLGEKHHFELELDGLHHILTAIAYILRNPMHHGVTATPLGYKYSSVSAVFSKELGRDISHEQMESKSHYLFLPGKVNLPAGFRIMTCGMIAHIFIISIVFQEKNGNGNKAVTITELPPLHYRILNRVYLAWILKRHLPTSMAEPITMQ